MEIKIRFNTDKDKVDASMPAWRVLVDGQEHLANKVNIQTDSWTTYDEVRPGFFKWHITCAGEIFWDEDQKECTIRASDSIRNPDKK